jgi:hypothetical protein
MPSPPQALGVGAGGVLSGEECTKSSWLYLLAFWPPGLLASLAFSLDSQGRGRCGAELEGGCDLQHLAGVRPCGCLHALPHTQTRTR